MRFFFARNDSNCIKFCLFWKSDKMVLGFASGSIFRTKIHFAQKLQCGTLVMWNPASSKSVEYLQEKWHTYVKNGVFIKFVFRVPVQGTQKSCSLNEVLNFL